MERALKKRMTIMLIALGILFGGIFLYKLFISIMIKRYLATLQSPTVTVSTMKVDYAPWQPKLKAVGSARAVLGVNVTTELAGMVKTIYFKPGSMVTQGTVLVQLNADVEIAQLNALRANAEIARITYERDKAQFRVQAVSKQQLQSDEYNLQNILAQVAQQEATLAKKTLRAPFSGRLGISYVNPGQYLNVGDKVTTLQTLDPIYVDFMVPQQALAELRVNQKVQVTTDTFPNKHFTGKVTTINPAVEVSTRNVEAEATIANPDYLLTPGMFTSVTVDVGSPKRYLTVPQAAVSFNPYGDIVFVVRESDKDKDDDGKPQLIAKQVFVTTGDVRGDQVTILSGLKAGDIIVTSGQLKLKNGSRVAINNSVQPANSADPVIPEKT